MALLFNPLTGKFDIVVNDHTLLQNIGTNTHAQIDTHIADGTKHFTEANIDHTNIKNIGSNSHAQIDSHISNTSNPHSVTAAQASAVATADHTKAAHDALGLSHDSLADVSANDHHAQQHLLNSLDDHSGTLDESQIDFTSVFLRRLNENTLSTNMQAIGFTGLDLDTHKIYQFKASWVNLSGSSANYYIYLNSDETATNYYVQRLVTNNTAISAARANSSLLLDLANNEWASLFLEIKSLYNSTNRGYTQLKMELNRWLSGSGSCGYLITGDYIVTSSNITAVTLKSNVSGAIGSGANYSIWSPNS